MQKTFTPEKVISIFKTIDEKSKFTDQDKRAILLIALSGMHVEPCLTAEWNEVDLENGIWTIPAQKTKYGKEHVIPLSNFMIQLFTDQNQLASNSKYVFPHFRDHNKPLNVLRLMQGLRHAGFGGENILYGFRGFIVSFAKDSELFDEKTIKDSLFQLPIEPIYNKKNLQDRKAFFDWYSDHMQKWSITLNI